MEMGFDILKFFSEIVKAIVGKEGLSNISIMLLLGITAFANVKKYLDKRKEKKKEKIKEKEDAFKKEHDLIKKANEMKRMAEHRVQIDIVLKNILKELEHSHVVRACVLQISNGSEFLNGQGIYKISMLYEQCLSLHTKTIKDRYQEVMINGRYDILFQNLNFSSYCLLKVDEIERMNLEFAKDPDNYMFLYMLRTDVGKPMAVVMVTLEDMVLIGQDFLMEAVYNPIMQIEKILKS